MKFKLYDEDFTSPLNRDKHFEKHIVKQQEFDYSVEEYEQRADALSRAKVDHKKIFGYIAQRDKNTVYCKYNKDTEEFVVYKLKDNVPYTITFFRRDWRTYNSEKYVDYIGEIVD